MATQTLVTTHDLEMIEDDGYRYELIAGELVRLPLTSPMHSWVCLKFAYPLHVFTDANELGIVLASGAGYQFEESPDTVLTPDVSFIRRDWITDAVNWDEYFRIIPDLLIEVLSPSERRHHIEQKIKIYLNKGVRLVIYADSEKRQLTLYATNHPPRVLTENDVLTFEDIVPGFSLPVADLFALPA